MAASGFTCAGLKQFGCDKNMHERDPALPASLGAVKVWCPVTCGTCSEQEEFVSSVLSAQKAINRGSEFQDTILLGDLLLACGVQDPMAFWDELAPIDVSRGTVLYCTILYYTISFQIPTVCTIREFDRFSMVQFM